MSSATTPPAKLGRTPYLVLMNLLPKTWRENRREGMIENRPWLTVISHLVLILGVAIVALPVYVTFVASTLAADEVLQAPMPLIPGTHLIENYTKVLGRAFRTTSPAPPWGG